MEFLIFLGIVIAVVALAVWFERRRARAEGFAIRAHRAARAVPPGSNPDGGGGISIGGGL